MSASETYWAAEKDTAKLLKSLDDHLEKWYEYVRTSNFLEVWQTAHQATYAGLRTGGKLGQAGNNGEYTTLRVNHYNNLKQHILTMVTGQRQYFEAKATNADYKSQAQAIIATSLCETVMRDKDLEGVSQMVVDMALSDGEGWCYKEWDFDAGDVTAETPEGDNERSGDIKFHALHSLDVARDPARNGPMKHDWYIIRTPENRYNVLATSGKGDEQKEQILKAPSRLECQETRPNLVDISSAISDMKSDEIWVYTFFHRKCPALPDGRMVRFISPTMSISDDKLLYAEVPLYRMASQEV